MSCHYACGTMRLMKTEINESDELHSCNCFLFMSAFTAVCICTVVLCSHVVYLDIKGCICHFTKWQIHPFISKGTTY